MNAADPLANLKDINLPPPVSAWPPAPGWWIIGALLLLTALVASWKLWVRWQQRAYRRAAVRELDNMYAHWQQQRDDAAFQRAVNQLLKQTALAAFPHAQVAALHGADWLAFLDRQLHKPAFSLPPLHALGDSYRADAQSVPAVTLHEAARLWIRRHRC